MITVTGATGALGRLVVEGLLAAGTPAGEVTAVVRSAEKAAQVLPEGVRIRVADYADAAALRDALVGTDRLLLISGSEVGRRVAQHRAVLDAAQEAGVELLVYTSAPRATTSALVLAPDHKATEEMIAATGLTAVVLRNNWYWENYDGPISQAAASGTLEAGTGDGRAWPAARADYAAAAVAVLTAPAPQPAVLELDGDEPLTLTALAAEISRQTGRPVAARPLDTEQHVGALVAAGLDEQVAGFVAAIDSGIAAGALDTGGSGISRLTGRPTQTLAERVAQVLAG